jgi:hypothetical protein
LGILPSWIRILVRPIKISSHDHPDSFSYPYFI